MKNSILKYQKYRQIAGLLNEYNALVSAQAADSAAKTQFETLVDTLESRINELMRPVRPYYSQQQSSREQLREHLKMVVRRGMVLARENNQQLMYNILDEYRSSIYNASSFTLRELCQQICDSLEQYPDQLATIGITTEQLTALRSQSESFESQMQETGTLVSERKAARNEIAALIKELNGMLRLYFDSFALMYKQSEPVFYSRYMALRRRKARRRYATEPTALSDISGMVTDAVTGQPVPNATVNLVENSHVILTESDGYYLFDELPEGDYTISCHAPGYSVPDIVPVSLGTDDSVVINFTLNSLAATA
jgi:hypothetical protein